MKRFIFSIIALSAGLIFAMDATALGFGTDNTNQQGQGQLQAQGQSSVNKNYNSNKATGVGVGIAAAGAYSDGSAANNSMTLNQTHEAYDRDNTPDAYAPPLTTSNGTCMGSSSIGGSGPGLGLSIGSTWTDDQCSARYNAKMLHDMGYKEVAVNIMCQIDSVAKAAGELCNPDTFTTTAGTKIDMSYRPSKELVGNFNNGFWK